MIGRQMPAFALEDLQDPQKTHDSSLMRGKVQLLNVWGTWCPACRDEHGFLVKMAEDYGVSIIGLNYKDDRQEALIWLDRLGNPYSTSIYDPDGKLGFDMGVYGAPETYLVDASGTVRYRHVGVVDQALWDRELKPLLDQYRESP